MKDWVIAVSNNGWTTNELGIAWLKHFDMHTRSRTVGVYRLLIIDGHESHISIDFRDMCKEVKIITLCMLAHSSHLLQPLDVAVFSLLKRAYGAEISGLARAMVTKIDKPAFIQVYKVAYNKVFTKENICAAFRGTGLVLFEPEVVLSKLDVKLRTPTPPALEPTTLWESKTPSNVCELGAQSMLVSERIREHHNSSPTEMLAQFNSLIKGASKMVHTATLIGDELSVLQKTIEALTKKKTRKRKYIQNQGILTMGEGSQLANPEGAGVVEGGEQHAKRVYTERAARTCRNCGKPGHNRRTCMEELLDSEDPK
jgi:hypothetical protein